MYAPPYNRIEERAEIAHFMRAHSFCLLVTGVSGELAASHLPCVVEERGEQLALMMHMARANPQWQSFYEGEEVLAVFSGPHAYVSPRWYADKPRVPTWNYAAVHAYGSVHIMNEAAAKTDALRQLVAIHDVTWLTEFESLPEQYMTDMLKGIVAFEISITRIETRWKLSQNRGRREQELIATALDESGEAGLGALAALTRRHLVER
ncbi:MAG: FMN-binding negative transcriptional regulator [Betaproteobacteria bacterium]|nr:FMN-binding negative transcriptional regulator [Betaproteobacteria bacterium]